MSYHAFGAAAPPPGLNVASLAAAIQAGVTGGPAALDALTVAELQNLTSQRLYALALDKINKSPETRSDMSYIGSFYVAASNVAMTRAAKQLGLAVGSVFKEMAEPILGKVLALARDLFPAAAGSLAAEAGEGLADIVPLIGAVAKAAFNVETQIKAQNDAASVAACQNYYHGPGKGPMGAPGSGYAGERRPADLMQGTLGEIFAIADQAYAANGGYAPYKTSNGPGDAYQKTKIDPQPGIPPERRKLLLALRLAIKKSYLDPSTDGGASLWPIYLDLLWKAHNLGQWNLSQVWYDYGAYVLPPLYVTPTGSAASEKHPGECALFERRAFDEFKGVLAAWNLTINPIYVQDRTRADELRATIEAAEAKLLGTPTMIFSPSTLALLLKKKPLIRITAGALKPPSHTGAVVVGVGVLAAAAALLFFL